MAMNCDFCTSEPGLLLMSNQENGDTQSIGSNCMPMFLKEMSITYGAWPKIEDVLTDELVREEAIKRGILPTPDRDSKMPPAGRGRGRKPANAGAETLADSAAITRAGIEPTDYSQIPDSLASDEELAERRRLAEATSQGATDV